MDDVLCNFLIILSLYTTFLQLLIASLLRQKVTKSIPGYFSLPFSRTMGRESTQPPTEKSTKIISWEVKTTSAQD